jgi:hypothetical protein
MRDAESIACGVESHQAGKSQDWEKSMITNLDGLFGQAEADWIWTPPPAVVGGGHAPFKVASRAITVQFSLLQLNEQTGALPTNPGSLQYTPATIVRAGHLIHRNPAHFSGVTTDGSNISVTIVPIESGYSLFTENTLQPAALFDVPSPGGVEGVVNDPQVNIEVGLKVWGVLSIFGYNFLATLVKGSG